MLRTVHYLDFVGQMSVVDNEGSGVVLHHFADGFFVHVVSLLVHVCAEEVLETVLDFRSRSQHRDPFLVEGGNTAETV